MGAAAIAAALLLAGCGDDDDASPVTVPDEQEATTTSSSTTTSTTAAPEEDEDAEVIAEIEAAYFAQWDAFIEILSDPNPSNPLIDQHFAGAAKETLLDTISMDIADGVITRRPEDPADFQPGIESIELESETEATLIECTVDGLVVVKRDSDEVVNDRVSVVRAENSFELIDGAWKLTSLVLIERLEDGETCSDVQ